MKLTEGFNLLATAPDGIKRLRELILSLAVQGKLVPQDPNDEPASELLKQIRAEKERLIAEGKIKKDKPLPAIGDDEKPFALPVGWEWVKFGDVAHISSGVTLGRKTAMTDPVLLPYLRVANVQRWKLVLDEVKEIVVDKSELDRFSLKKGDLLITEGGDWDKVGRTCVWGGELPICLHQNHVFKVRAIFSDWNFHWAELFLNSNDARAYFASSAKQTTNLASINMTQLKNCLFPIPPLAEQSRIVTKVEELMALCDALEMRGQLQAEQHARLTATLFDALVASESAHQLQENWARLAASFDLVLDRPQAVDALEQTILQLAVRGLLVPQDPADEPASELLKQIRAEKDRLIAEGKIKKDKPLPAISDEEKPFDLPEGWEWVRCADYFDELCTGPFGSVLHKEDYINDGVPLINPSHMVDGKIIPDYSITLTVEFAEKLKVYRLSAGDVVLARRGEVGRYALVTNTEDGWLCGTGSFFVKLNGKISREYIGLIFQEQSFRRYLQGESVGTTMTNLNQKILLEAVLGIPPLAEQSRIVARVEALRALCGQLRQRLAASRDTQGQLASALLAQG
ncbi:restriction endonuclease subunit S [Vogesella sp. DC21W]|uniref:Restriction endonuclease subunit S n=1 Tax=Vogesella aquatica TaxID=2984206 RepID=A0ABT5IYF3_9NEIS|nr:restriction endonuclease subunit S [Vogesella aquatica]MDC7717601.1 restriction endonuclease subunit S [Vogesella aquatica]